MRDELLRKHVVFQFVYKEKEYWPSFYITVLKICFEEKSNTFSVKEKIAQSFPGVFIIIEITKSWLAYILVSLEVLGPLGSWAQ